MSDGQSLIVHNKDGYLIFNQQVAIMKQINAGFSRKSVGNGTKKIIILFLLFTMAYCVNTHIIRFAIVSGESMYPTFLDRDVIIINQMNYTPSRGDVALIDISGKPISGEYIVKRIIAVEGDTVTLDYENNFVYVNDTKILEPYLNFDQEDPMMELETTNSITYQVPVGTVFVMGDNRNNSLDSRNSMLGMVTEADIVGKVCRCISIFQYFC